MSLARNISFFVNFDQGHERKNLKDRENSVFAVSNVIKVEIEKSEMLRVKDIILLHREKKTVWFYLKNPVRYLTPVFA